jgi:solute carrier family 13 (sodium-dependent dicarboxylate transporter), member 2/3/5
MTQADPNMTLEAKPSSQRRQFLTLALGAGLVLAGLLLPPSNALPRSGLISLSVLLMAVLFWTTEALNTTITGLIILVLLPATGALSYEQTFAGLGQSTLWRLVGIVMITMGLSKAGLDRRIAVYILKLARGNVYAILFLMVVAAQILVFFMPSPSARAFLLATTFLGILQGLGLRPPSNIGKIVFLGIPICAITTSASLITGATVEVYAVGLFATLLNYNFSYVSWMIINLPVTFLTCFLVLPLLIRLFPPEMKRLEGAETLIRDELARMGPLSVAEKKMMAAFGLLLVLWFSGASEAWPAELMVATLLFMPGMGILKWTQVQKDVPWGMVLLFGSSLALALALQQNRVVQWASDLFVAQVGHPQPAALALLVFALTAIVRLGMTNMTGVVATLFPLSITVAATTGVNPAWLGMICTLSAATGFFFPSQNQCNLLTYSFGYYSAREMAWAGAWACAIEAAVLILAALFYWPLVGLPVYAP